MNFTGCVTARYNSTRVPLKAVQEVGGSPLVDRCIRVLARAAKIDDILLFGDCPSIKHYIGDYDYRFVQRPIELSADDATFAQILDAALPYIDTDYIVFMTYTAPFFTTESINTMIEQVEHTSYDSAFAVTKHKQFAWFNNKRLNYGDAIPKTQKLAPVYFETSNIYIFEKDYYIKTKQRIGKMPYMHEVDAVEGWDIDTVEDLEIARAIANE